VPSLTALAPRTEFWLTATAEGLGSSSSSSSSSDKPSLPAALWDDAIFLNGVQMSVDAGGNLPAIPIPGRSVPAGSADPVTLPAYSYGYILFPAAQAAACL
jgi:hypothetical protein